MAESISRSRFLDSHKMGSFTEEQLMKLQKSPPDEFGVKYLNILYNHEANVLYCLLEAPSIEAVEMNHTKLNHKCDWMDNQTWSIHRLRAVLPPHPPAKPVPFAYEESLDFEKSVEGKNSPN